MSVCVVCLRRPERANSWCTECSHVDCPHRRKAWSERPDPSEYHTGPWPKNVDEDPKPADEVIK